MLMAGAKSRFCRWGWHRWLTEQPGVEYCPVCGAQRLTVPAWLVNTLLAVAQQKTTVTDTEMTEGEV